MFMFGVWGWMLCREVTNFVGFLGGWWVAPKLLVSCSWVACGGVFVVWWGVSG